MHPVTSSSPIIGTDSTTSSVGAEEEKTIRVVKSLMDAAQLRETPNGFHIIPLDLSKADPNKLLANGLKDVRVVFQSNDAEHPFRTVKLEKEGEDGKRVPDDERQSKVTQKFAELKYLLNLGQKDQVRYNVTQHILIVINESGNHAYDLQSVEDVARLLKIHKDDAKGFIDQLKKIRDTLTTKEYLGVEVERFPVLMQDYIGRVDGPAPFDSNRVKAPLEPSSLFVENKNLTFQGEILIKQMHRVRLLSDIVEKRYKIKIGKIDVRIAELKKYSQGLTPKDRREMARLESEKIELTNEKSEFINANSEAMQSVLMGIKSQVPDIKPGEEVIDNHTGEKVRTYSTELIKAFRLLRKGDNQTDETHHINIGRVAGHVADEVLIRIAKAYQPNRISKLLPKKLRKTQVIGRVEKRHAAVVGSLFFDLFSRADSTVPVRESKTLFMQKRGIRKMPKRARAEDFLLYNVLNQGSKSPRQYHKNELIKEALEIFEKIEVKEPPANYKQALKSLKTFHSDTHAAIEKELKKYTMLPQVPETIVAPEPVMMREETEEEEFDGIDGVDL